MDRTDARARLPSFTLSARYFDNAPHWMIAAESSNRQQICKRLREPFSNKLRELQQPGWQKMSEADLSHRGALKRRQPFLNLLQQRMQ
jgi:hypothetical protein